jgi:exodeoxyribonuclease VII large subunit
VASPPKPSTPEQPWPVRTVARLIGDWVDRLGRVWVEGQVTDLRRRPAGRAFLVLRDPVASVSLRVHCEAGVCDQVSVADGARVVVHAKPSFLLTNGALSLTAYEIRPVGVGALLQRLERLRAVLAAEGLFAADRKRPIPFLPGLVGLVCGRASAAERDVRENAVRRWPAVRFRVCEAAVQGPYAVAEVIEALRTLDADPDVDVIVIARGGGSLEDLLPFSDEALCRAVARCRTPVVTAIGHEQDVPLIDLVADLRASTPTDAGKLVVPDVAEEASRVSSLQARARRAVTARVEREAAQLAALRSRPALAEPQREVDRRAAEITGLTRRAWRAAMGAVESATSELRQTTARVAALSPAATLARGYAVVQRDGGAIVRAPSDVVSGDPLRIRLADGELSAAVT